MLAMELAKLPPPTPARQLTTSRVVAVHGLGQEEHENRPQAPDREADVLGEHGEEQVAAGDRPAGGLPEGGVLRAPVVDPATGARSDGDRRGLLVGGGGGGGQGPERWRPRRSPPLP